MSFTQIWDEKKIIDGFKRFNDENGHYPTAPEIDRCDYLPSSRQLQRIYGGLIQFRTKAGLSEQDLNYGKGQFRSNIGRVSGIVSIAAENTMHNFLTNIYGEICVHEQKKYGEGKNTVDFYIYGETRNFGVEVFNTYSLRDLANHLNIKLKKYYDFTNELYFVVFGGEFKQEDIDKHILRKRQLPLLTNMKCMTYEVFKERCLEISKPLEINAPYHKFVNYQVKYTKNEN